MNRSTRRQTNRSLAAVLGAALSLLVATCQSVSSDSTSAAPTNATPVIPPRSVAVYEFAFEVAGLHSDPGLMSGGQGPAKRLKSKLRPEETPAQRAARLAGLLSDTIASELAAQKIPATRQPKDVPMPAKGLAVKGEFLQADEGNRLKRAVIGLGAGATETVVQVEVFDLDRNRHQPVVVFGAGSESKPTPGGMIMRNPYVAAAKYVLSRHSTETDFRALGKQIAQDLAQVERALPLKPEP